MRFHSIVAPFGISLFLGVVSQVSSQSTGTTSPQAGQVSDPNTSADPPPTSSTQQGQITNWFNDAASSISSAAKNAAKNFDEASKSFANTVSNKTEAARKTLSEQMAKVKEEINEQTEAAKKQLGKVKDELNEKTESARKSIAVGMETIKNAVNGTFQNMKQAVQTQNETQIQNSTTK